MCLPSPVTPHSTPLLSWHFSTFSWLMMFGSRSKKYSIISFKQDLATPHWSILVFICGTGVCMCTTMQSCADAYDSNNQQYRLHKSETCLTNFSCFRPSEYYQLESGNCWGRSVCILDRQCHGSCRECEQTATAALASNSPSVASSKT